MNRYENYKDMMDYITQYKFFVPLGILLIINFTWFISEIHPAILAIQFIIYALMGTHLWVKR